jgi:hypothetical protein
MFLLPRCSKIAERDSRFASDSITFQIVLLTFSEIAWPPSISMTTLFA